MRGVEISLKNCSIELKSDICTIIKKEHPSCLAFTLLTLFFWLLDRMLLLLDLLLFGGWHLLLDFHFEVWLRMVMLSDVELLFWNSGVGREGLFVEIRLCFEFF